MAVEYAGAGTATSAVYAWFPYGRIRRVSPPVGYYSQPWVHPSGREAVFWGGGLGFPSIWRADLDTFKAHQITSTVSGSWHPGYGLDGGAIVFVSDRHGDAPADDMREAVERLPVAFGPDDSLRTSVMLMDLDGRHHRAVTNGKHHDQRPALSPDGRRIVFASDRGGALGLWTVEAEEFGQPYPFPVGVEQPYAPRWSATGAAIYFVSLAASPPTLYAVPSAGGEARRVAALDALHSEPLAAPFVDPSGDSLLVTVAEEEDEAVYEVSLVGDAPRRLRPPGFRNVRHATRARNGVVLFDSPDPVEVDEDGAVPGT